MSDERLATLGALAVPASLFLPWYGVSFSEGLVRTGWGAFSLVEAALVLTAGGALALLVARRRQGEELTLPFRDGTLLAMAGAWACLLVVFRLFDTPEVRLGLVEADSDPRYGIFIALAGAIALTVAGVRHRRREPEHAELP